MRPLKIPVYPLTEYLPADLAATGVYVERLEESLARRPNRVALHRHDHFEIFWVQGTGVHFNDFREYPLEQATFVTASPGQIHGWPDSEGLRGVMIGFTTAFFDGREPPPTALMRYPFVWSGHPVLKLAETDHLDSLVQLLEQEASRRQDDWQEVVRSGLRMILTLANRSAPGLEEGQTRGSGMLLNFRSLLEEKFRTTTAVSAYARLLGVTAGHLNDTVSSQTGRPAGALIRERILLEARRLLFHSELQIAEIAYHLGFDDPSYFARFFRREDGRPPGDFRTEIREKYRSGRESSG